MEKFKTCSKCEKANEECSREQVRQYLKNSECECCDSTTYGYPYGPNESRHCNNCGAEWSIWK